MKIIFSGDFAPLVSAADYAKVKFDGIRDVVASADFHITDLECPLTANSQKIAKSGPHIKAEPDSVSILKQAGVTSVCMANNHIFDFGEVGILDSVTNLKKENIGFTGIYTDDAKNANPLILHASGKTAAVFNYCEHEFSVRENGVSAAGFSPIRAFYDIAGVRGKTDFIVIVYHGGNEYYNLPNPGMQKELRFLIDAGADAVICHHTHVVSGMEYYKGKPIVYGLGNFFFPYPDEPDSWHTGLLCKLTLADTISAELIPIEQCRDGYAVTMHTLEIQASVMNEVERLSAVIGNTEQLEQSWQKYSESVSKGTIKNIMHMSKWERLQIKLGKKPAEIIDESALLQTYLSYSCSAHHALAVEVLKKNMKKG